MIDPTSPAASRQATPTMPVAGASAKGPFDDALAAASRAKASQDARESEMDSIRSKGFTNWARDTRMEKLKEELRRKVLAAMGLTEGDLSKASDAVRQVLEQKIKEEVEKQMMALQKQEDQKSEKSGDTAKDGGAAPSAKAPARPTASPLLAAQEASQQADLPAADSNPCEPGKKDRAGKSCPVIPALAMPGGESLF